MKSKTILLMVLFFAMALCMAGRTCAAPMGTAFTYQGWLMDKNDQKPADGLHDFLFSLFADPCNGTQMGSTISEDNIDVKKGYFAVRLDFAASEQNVFNGDARWLEVAVRPGASIDPCDFDTLSPRTELAPTPYALHTRGIFVDANGNVGIGTTIPTEKLGVVGNARIDGNLKVTGEQEVDGVVTATNGFAAGGTTVYEDGWIRVFGTPPSGNHDLVFRVGGSTAHPDYDDPTEGIEIMRLTGAGDLGIGTMNPIARLDVTGNIAVTGTVDGVDVSAHAASANAHHTPPMMLPPSGPAGGDLSGSYPNPSVVNDSHTHGDSTVLDNISINNTRLYAPAGVGNVGIGTTSPNSSKGSDGYLDVKDVYLRDSGKWASESGGAANVYRSEWFPVGANQTYTEDHGLGAYPDIVQVYIAENSDGSGWCTTMGWFQDWYEDRDWGSQTTVVEMTDSQIVIRTRVAGSNGIVYIFDKNGTRIAPSSGYCRIVAVRY